MGVGFFELFGCFLNIMELILMDLILLVRYSVRESVYVGYLVCGI